MAPLRLFGIAEDEDKANYYIFAAMSFYAKYLREIYFMAFITFCIAFSIDLYFTIKNPLKSPIKRMKFYHISWIANLVALFTIEALTLPKCSVFRTFDIS
jgi:hypothetical protein